MRPLALAVLLAVPHAVLAQPTPDALVADIRSLSASTDNDARFDALTALLRAHDLAFTVEPVVLDAPTRADRAGARDSRMQGRNVVVTLGEGSEILVVGAHYDAKWMTETTISRGAVDNGASSVMLVHAADAVRHERLGRQVRFVWFDFEESGLLGSAKYLQAHADDHIVAMLNYDINAYGDTVFFGPPAGGADPTLQRLMLESCAHEGVDCVRFDGMPPGDDRSFGRRGIPTLSVAILPASELHQLWLLLHARGAGLAQGFQPAILQLIHTPGDVPELVDGTAVTRALRLAIAVIRAVGALEHRGAWDD